MTISYELTPISTVFPKINFNVNDIEVKVGTNAPSVPLNPFYVPQADVLEDLLVELSLPADALACCHGVFVRLDRACAGGGSPRLGTDRQTAPQL